MKRLMTTLLVLTLAAVISGCDRNKVDDSFLTNTDAHLKVEGETVLSYDVLMCQQGFNRQKCRFQVAADDFSKYYLATLSFIPGEVGQNVDAHLKWGTPNSSSTKQVTLETVKIEGDKIWLWNRDEGVELTVQLLY